jgi:hypothetical protein
VMTQLFLGSLPLPFRFGLKRILDQLSNCFRPGGLVWLLLGPGFNPGP